MPLCGQCKTQESRDGQWTCKGCHAQYQKNFRVRSMQNVQDRAFRRGYEAFRSAAVARFNELPARAEMNGLTAAEIVRQIPAATIQGRQCAST